MVRFTICKRMKDLIIKELRKSREEKKVAYGNKLIKIEVRFWTHAIASDKKKLIPKVAWDSGTIHVLKNPGHGIMGSKSIPFNSLSELQPTIERTFKKNGITLLHSRKYRPLYYT
jgi:hypothetical protein